MRGQYVRVNAREFKLISPACVAEVKTSRMTLENWANLRREGFGGSDASKIMNPGKYGGPLKVYLSKVADLGPDAGNDETLFGILSEDMLREKYLPTLLAREGYEAGKDYEIFTSPWFYRSETFPFAVANIDGLFRVYVPLVVDGQTIPPGLYVLELKTGGNFFLPQWSSGARPDGYFCQCQHYMGTLGLDGALLFGLIDRKPFLRFLPRDEEYISQLFAREQILWEHVLAEVPPIAQGEGDLDAALDLYPEGTPGEVREVDGLADYAGAYAETKAEIDRLEGVLTDIKGWLVCAVGEAESAVDGNASAKWSRWETSSFDSKRFEADHPELFAQYRKVGRSSRLNVKIGAS